MRYLDLLREYTMRLLVTADWHIKLGQRKVPRAWQANRFHLLNAELNKVACDAHVIAGDIFDSDTPDAEEIELYFELVSEMEHDTIIFSGNHEAKTKNSGILHRLAAETNRCNQKVQVVFGGYRSEDFDIIDFFDLIN